MKFFSSRSITEIYPDTETVRIIFFLNDIPNLDYRLLESDLFVHCSREPITHMSAWHYQSVSRGKRIRSPDSDNQIVFENDTPGIRGAIFTDIFTQSLRSLRRASW